MDHGLVNAFLAKEDLSESDQLLRHNLLSLHEAVQKLTHERATAAESFQRKEQELLRTSGALENQMFLVAEMARRMGLQPLHPPEETEQDQEQPE